jgi:hypothetical protein
MTGKCECREGHVSPDNIDFLYHHDERPCEVDAVRLVTVIRDRMPRLIESEHGLQETNWEPEGVGVPMCAACAEHYEAKTG